MKTVSNISAIDMTSDIQKKKNKNLIAIPF